MVGTQFQSVTNVTDPLCSVDNRVVCRWVGSRGRLMQVGGRRTPPAGGWAPSGVFLLLALLLLLGVCPSQHLGQLVGPGDDSGGVQAPRLT